jgi:hypothetical protein
MSATFKCLISGNTVTFIHQVDIDSMKDNTGYVRVETNPVEVAPEAPKKAGRPAKKTEAAEVH